MLLMLPKCKFLPNNWPILNLYYLIIICETLWQACFQKILMVINFGYFLPIRESIFTNLTFVAKLARLINLTEVIVNFKRVLIKFVRFTSYSNFGQLIFGNILSNLSFMQQLIIQSQSKVVISDWRIIRWKEMHHKFRMVLSSFSIVW